MPRYVWDGKCTIVKDHRRALFCAKQVMRRAGQGTDLHRYASVMVNMLEDGHTPYARHATMIETLYRQHVLHQQTPQAIINGRKQ